MTKIKILCLAILISFTACTKQEIPQVEKWEVYEITLQGPKEGNPFMEIDLNATFNMEESEITVPGFYDGNGIYKIRFSPENVGNWTYSTTSNSELLDGKKGKLTCVEAQDKNHGPLIIVNTYYLQYADGTPFYSIGTTAYQWTSVKQKIQEKTLETLKKAPFNKIRMCVFPKTYKYGNDTEPWAYPFLRKGEESDFTELNFEFFQNFDLRIKQLLEMGIQADVILFHPYDKWGYCQMGNEMNLRYVKYMIARIGAFRNVWWSLANEWDVPEIKETIDWEAIGNCLQENDPHQRFRGIHNWYNTEDHFYDHNRPWITHTSTQTSQFFNAIKWREQYKKPLLFDEMRYEGDVKSGWGNMSSEEMASYFWMAGLSGGYPTHGDTYANTADDSTEVRWWAKGGLLVGKSPERIAFFKSVMEQAPVTEMVPELNDGGEPENINNNIYKFSKQGEYYLIYVADNIANIEVKLPEDMEFEAEIIDTWNMKISPVQGKFKGLSKIDLPEKPYMAIRLTKISN